MVPHFSGSKTRQLEKVTRALEGAMLFRRFLGLRLNSPLNLSESGGRADQSFVIGRIRAGVLTLKRLRPPQSLKFELNTRNR
jgi:hypothetical protein